MIKAYTKENEILLFDSDKVSQISSEYCLDKVLPDHQIIGLIDWDDFLIVDKNNKTFQVPTVPIDTQYLNSFECEVVKEEEVKEELIKWYVTPLIFGGDPSSSENINFIDIETHIKLVVWWNNKYQEIKKNA